MDVVATQVLVASVSETVKVLTQNILNSRWWKDTEEAKSLVEQFMIEQCRDQFINKHVLKVQRMRTIHSSESDVMLSDIYFPLKVTFHHTKDVETIDDGVTIKYNGVVNIIGIAGQGKSTILRKLFLEEIEKKERFPFFVELRRLGESNIQEYFFEILRDLGLKFKDEDAYFLLQSRKVVLMLDGFDEVHPNQRSVVLSNIKILNERFNCPILTTSRPDTEICREPGIRNVFVNKLGKKDCIGILEKIAQHDEFNEIVNVLDNNNNLSQTIVTPILVNLLYVCYPHWESIPTSVVGFYSKLFPTLYHRHDKLKNFSRPRKSSVSSENSLWCFSSLCFQSLHDGVYDFKEDNLKEYTSIALQMRGLEKCEVDNFIEDICNVTCLIQSDGYDRFVFLHKSVQEFHAALFINKLPYKRKVEFYDFLIDICDISDKYDNVIGFLKDIDSQDYNKHFLIKKIELHGINKIEDEPSVVVDSLLDKILSDKRISFSSYIDDENLKREGMGALDRKTIISGLSLLYKGERNSLVLDGISLNNINIRAQKHFILKLNHKILPRKKNSVGLENDQNRMDGYEFTVSLKLKDVIDAFNIYELYKEGLLRYLTKIYKELYLPTKRTLDVMESTFDSTFGFFKDNQ
ncbi:TPA: NACHT domain-containing protein [Yersinia enterocolitica]|nr:NACHT domain-containing protein [Yersinia enterocolitica]